MSIWQDYNLAEEIVQILRDVPPKKEGHHFGLPFLTAYQIAIELAFRHPELLSETGYPIGGSDTGENRSLSKYIAKQLSTLIKGGRLPDIEGVFISDWHLHDISFETPTDIIHSSLTRTNADLSMYRFNPCERRERSER